MHRSMHQLTRPSLVQIMACCLFSGNTYRYEQNGCHFTGLLKCIFLNENGCTLIQISLIFFFFLSMGTTNGLALNRLQIITWSTCDPVSWHTFVSPGFSDLNSTFENHQMFHNCCCSLLLKNFISVNQSLKSPNMVNNFEVQFSFLMFQTSMTVVFNMFGSSDDLFTLL